MDEEGSNEEIAARQEEIERLNEEEEKLLTEPNFPKRSILLFLPFTALFLLAAFTEAMHRMIPVLIVELGLIYLPTRYRLSTGRELEDLRKRRFFLQHGKPVFEDLFRGWEKAGRTMTQLEFLQIMLYLLYPAFMLLVMLDRVFQAPQTTIFLAIPLLLLFHGFFLFVLFPDLMKCWKCFSSVRVFRDGVHTIDKFIEAKGTKVFLAFNKITRVREGSKYEARYTSFYLSGNAVFVEDGKGFLLALEKGFGERWDEVFVGQFDGYGKTAKGEGGEVK